MKHQLIKFEGPEKKLDIILNPPLADLKENVDHRWDRVVKSSKTHILSMISSGIINAYLLSESSLFVWDDRILMITCGQSTLINALPDIIDIVGPDRVAQIFYERKNLMFPHEQQADFEDEIKDMTKDYPGKSYRLGPANDDHIHLYYSQRDGFKPLKYSTLQILMQNLDPMTLNLFSKKHFQSSETIDQKSGLARIYPNMKIDSHLFSPYGYSLNGIDRSNYYTIHVTPQICGSYASFETNVTEFNYTETILKILKVFRPGKFSMLVTTSQNFPGADHHLNLEQSFADYRSTEKGVYEFDCGYVTTFIKFTSIALEIEQQKTGSMPW